jgi:hypothetical protein
LKLPWYSFLYRVLGAQGTFWLWLLAILAMWWTTKPALIRLVNRNPQQMSLEEAREPGATTRWVSVRGLEVGLDRRLLLSDQGATLPPMALLLDSESAPGRWWLETRALADLHVGIGAVRALGGALGALSAGSESQLIRRFAKLEGGSEEFLPPPERALLLQYPTSDFSLAPEPPRAKEGDEANRFRQILAKRIQLVRKRVHVSVVEGVLDPIPEVVKTRLEKELGVTPAPYLLQVDQKPSELETRVFAVAAVLLVLLGGGLYGATRAKREDDAASSEAQSEVEASPEVSGG